MKCVRCKCEKPNDGKKTCSKCLEYHRQFRKKHPEYMRGRYKKLRNEILMLLGNKCVRCGFDNKWALDIDHVNGQGTKERKSFKHSLSYLLHILKELKSGSHEYQILCANCNRIKKHENHEF